MIPSCIEKVSGHKVRREDVVRETLEEAFTKEAASSGGSLSGFDFDPMKLIPDLYDEIDFCSLFSSIKEDLMSPYIDR